MDSVPLYCAAITVNHNLFLVLHMVSWLIKAWCQWNVAQQDKTWLWWSRTWGLPPTSLVWLVFLAGGLLMTPPIMTLVSISLAEMQLSRGELCICSDLKWTFDKCLWALIEKYWRAGQREALKVYFQFYFLVYIPTEVKYNNLCSMCRNPGQCDGEDAHAGYQGVLRCLVDSHGDVAWTKFSAVTEFFKGRPEVR